MTTATRAVAALVVAYALAGCAVANPATSPAAGPTGTSAQAVPGPATPSVEPTESGPATAPEGQTQPASETEVRTPQATPSEAEPAPAESDATGPIPLTATVDPVCVSPGELVRLVVQTEPGVPVIFNAVYAGEEGGGPPPYGSGHGGNDGGNADDEGVFIAEWTVGASAPTGDARVDVVVARTDGSGTTRQMEVPFTVRRATDLDGC